MPAADARVAAAGMARAISAHHQQCVRCARGRVVMGRHGARRVRDCPVERRLFGQLEEAQVEGWPS